MCDILHPCPGCSNPSAASHLCTIRVRGMGKRTHAMSIRFGVAARCCVSPARKRRVRVQICVCVPWPAEHGAQRKRQQNEQQKVHNFEYHKRTITGRGGGTTRECKDTSRVCVCVCAPCSPVQCLAFNVPNTGAGWHYRRKRIAKINTRHIS